LAHARREPEPRRRIHERTIGQAARLATRLMTYSANLAGMFRRMGYYVDRILKGTKPGDLPIEQPREFELVINLKTAKALGLTLPSSLLMQANETIQ
jgi:putative tryptophan/tyrosine transport system substrate-binding protein